MITTQEVEGGGIVDARKYRQCTMTLYDQLEEMLTRFAAANEETSRMTETGSPKVEQLKDLINYQNGSVVSREIIRKSTGTVTLFTFDKGQRLSEHTAPFDALVYIVDGEVEVNISR